MTQDPPCFLQVGKSHRTGLQCMILLLPSITWAFRQVSKPELSHSSSNDIWSWRSPSPRARTIRLHGFSPRQSVTISSSFFLTLAFSKVFRHPSSSLSIPSLTLQKHEKRGTVLRFLEGVRTEIVWCKGESQSSTLPLYPAQIPLHPQHCGHHHSLLCSEVWRKDVYKYLRKQCFFSIKWWIHTHHFLLPINAVYREQTWPPVPPQEIPFSYTLSVYSICSKYSSEEKCNWYQESMSRESRSLLGTCR